MLRKMLGRAMKATKLTMDSGEVPVLEVSAGIMLLAMVSSDRLKTMHISSSKDVVECSFLSTYCVHDWHLVSSR